MNINLCILIIVIVLLIFWWVTTTQTHTSSDYEVSANKPLYVCCQYTPPSGPEAYFWWLRKDCQPDDVPKRKNFKIMPGIKSKSACEAWNNKV